LTSLGGLSGGSTGSRSDSSSGNGKKEKEKPEITTFKYSTRFTGPLHEAIMLGSEPFFVSYSSVSGHFELIRKIEETNRLLIPPYPEEYPYEPIKFDSLGELRRYEDMALDETIDSLYKKVKETVALYIDQDAEVINLISADIMWTYFQDLYPTTHYYDITGKENGIGKSTIGYVFEGLAYRGVRMTDPSGANLYRILGKVEPGQCIIIADEADRVHQDKEMLAIYKEGYAIGGKVPKINTNTLKQEFFHCYCFKIRIAEESLRGNITKGVIDRSFLIKAIRGRPTHDIKEVLHPANRNERLARLHEDIKSLRKLLLAYRLIHFSDNQQDIEIRLQGRDKELCKPVLHLFHSSEAYLEVEKTLQTFLDRKNKRKKNTAIEPVIYCVVVDIVSRFGRMISTSQMWNTIKDSIPGSYDEKKPNEYQTQDYDTIHRNDISKTICDNFGAEREHRRNGNVFVFDEAKLVKAGRAYDIEASFQSTLGREAGEPREHFEEREGQNYQKDENVDKKIIEMKKEDDNISKENNSGPNTSEKAKDENRFGTTDQPSQPSQPSHTKPNIYRIGTTDSFGCPDCELKGDKWFMQEHVYKGQNNNKKNKVDEASSASSESSYGLF
jgi:hypothetical protein